MASVQNKESLATELLGSWRMISWTYEVVDTGEQVDALGRDPHGYINYAPDGRVMVLVLRADRPTPASLIPTPEEKIALYDTMFAYAGTYEIEDDRVVHHLDMSWNNVWENTEQIRFITLKDAELIYHSPPAKSPLDGRECVHTVKFTKVGSSDLAAPAD